MTYWELFTLDLTTWLVCVVAMLTLGGMNAFHPAAYYFFFHLYSFTYRLFQLANGAPTLFETWGRLYIGVTRGEIERASMVTLATLVIMTVIWLVLARIAPAQHGPSLNKIQYRPFAKELMWPVLYITLPAGLIGLVFLRNASFLVGGIGYQGVLSTCFGMSLLPLIYYYGPRPQLLAALLLYIMVFFFSSTTRLLVMLPIMFVIFCYMRQHNIRWPSLRVVGGLLIVAFLFVAGKPLGAAILTGDMTQIKEVISSRFDAVHAGEDIDATFLDMLAVTMQQVDDNGTFFYGATYTPMLTLAIPRELWPEKPGTHQWRGVLEQHSRPMSEIGAVTTIPGEAYANFGYPGIVGVAVLLAGLLHLLYTWMLRAPYHSLVTFWSLCMYSLLLQIFRDGLVSFVVCQVTVFLPLTLITVLHLLLLRRSYNQDGTIAGWTTCFGKVQVP